jgi:hypothetical protein
MAVRKCNVCIGSDVKEELLLKFPHLKEAIEDIPECNDAGELVICQGKGKAKREKRAPSEYNLYIKSCLSKHDLKGKPFGTAGKFMKECALEYKQTKKGA